MSDQAKLPGDPNSDNWSGVDCESMIERACWINYKPVTNDYWLIGRGFIRRIRADKAACVTRASRAQPSHPGRLHPLDRYLPLDGGQVVFDSDTFRGSLHAGRACWARGSLSKFWHTAGISGLVNCTRGSCHDQDVVCTIRRAHPLPRFSIQRSTNGRISSYR